MEKEYVLDIYFNYAESLDELERYLDNYTKNNKKAYINLRVDDHVIESHFSNFDRENKVLTLTAYK
ncbi:hypothetical protein D3C74_480170 [compost metagenome]